MRRKRKELLGRIFLAITLAVVMCIGSVAPAFADPVYGTEANPARAAITKLIKMPEGTNTPAATFTFTIAKKSLDDSTAAADLTRMPTIASKNVTFSASDTGTVVSGTKEVRKETAALFDGVTFPHAGVYVYTITEVPNTYTIADAAKESMTYSTGSYDVAVYVKDGTAGTYVFAIAATIVIKDTADQTIGDKVDPTPGSVAGEYSDMVFTNTYIRRHGGTDPTDPSHQALGISSAVAGDYANKSKYFEYNITATKPALVVDPVTYKAYVVNTNTNAVVTSAANGTGMLTDGAGGYFLFTSGTAQTINLMHDQKLVFIDTHVGAQYVAIQSAAADYTASVRIIVDGGSPIDIPNSLPNQSLSTQTRILGQAANSAAFTNTYKTVTPTGLDISNLPFIVMLAVGIGGLVVLVALKPRRKEDYVAH